MYIIYLLYNGYITLVTASLKTLPDRRVLRILSNRVGALQTAQTPVVATRNEAPLPASRFVWPLPTENADAHSSRDSLSHFNSVNLSELRVLLYLFILFSQGNKHVESKFMLAYYIIRSVVDRSIDRLHKFSRDGFYLLLTSTNYFIIVDFLHSCIQV